MTALALVTLAGACSADTGASPADPASTPSQPELANSEALPRPTGPNLSPLRGLPVDDAEVQARPALAVKVDNRPEARPQIGLEFADVVYEELTEGGITRLLAVFHSTLPPEVGPIRSVRAVDPALLAPLGGVFAYSGGTRPNVEALEHQRSTPVDETAAGPGMRRAHDRRAPHNLIGVPARLIALVPEAGPPVPLFNYGPLQRESGEPCTSVSIVFSEAYVSTYDWIDGRGWARSTHGQRLTTTSGAEIAPTNLVVAFVADQSAEATIGRGEALVLRDGVLLRGAWQRTRVEEPMRLVDGFGETLRLAPGTTWVHLALPFRTGVELCTRPRTG